MNIFKKLFGKPSTVYMTKSITSESLVKLYELLNVPAKGKVAVKISTGEPGGHNYLDPKLIEPLVTKVGGTIVECNTAYGGVRDTTEGNLQAAKDHGYCDIAKVDIMDAEGEFTIPMREKKYMKYDIVGKNAMNYDFVLNIAHFKGHPMGGFGGVIKNQSIGFSSRNGKAYQHSTGKVQTVEDFHKLLLTTVDEGESIDNADWVGITHGHKVFHECMANCAAAVADYYGPQNILYFNVMNNLSVDCDCSPCPADPEMNDIGVFASLDPVAIDQACLDQVFNYQSVPGDDAAALQERIKSRFGMHMVKHAEKIGLGTRKYNLINIDEVEV